VRSNLVIASHAPRALARWDNHGRLVVPSIISFYALYLDVNKGGELLQKGEIDNIMDKDFRS
jgi:hypothetical protein